jgi:hypothetical protein
MGNHVIDPTARDKLDAFYAEEESDDQEAIDDEDK